MAKSTKKRKACAAGIASMLLAAALLAGCSSGQSEKAPESETFSSETVSDQTVAAVQDLEIETPCGSLRYPDQWADLVQVDQAGSSDAVAVAFNAKVGEATYPLFEVSIGAENGQFAGVITGDDGVARNVYISLSDIDDVPGLSETEQKRLYAMQEDVNYVIDNLG